MALIGCKWEDYHWIPGRIMDGKSIDSVVFGVFGVSYLQGIAAQGSDPTKTKVFLDTFHGFASIRQPSHFLTEAKLVLLSHMIAANKRNISETDGFGEAMRLNIEHEIHIVLSRSASIA